jgi:hypothetical protein
MDEAFGAQKTVPGIETDWVGRPVYSYRRLQGSGQGSSEEGYTVGGVRYRVMWSTDLTTWKTGSAYLVEVGEPRNNEDGTVTVSVAPRDGTSNCSFFKLEITPTD